MANSISLVVVDLFNFFASFLFDSLVEICMFMEIYSFLLGCPFCWHSYCL